MGEKTHKKSSKSTGDKDKKNKSTKKRPLWDKGVGYTRAIMTLRLANTSYRNGWFDGDGVHSYPRRNLTTYDFVNLRLETLEQALRKIKLYAPLVATMQISSAAQDIIDRFDNAVLTQTLTQTLDQLEGELRGAGMLPKGDDWTFDDSTGRWYKWDDTINGYVYDNGDKNIYNADGSTTWILADGSVEGDTGVDEVGEQGEADAHYDMDGTAIIDAATPGAVNDTVFVEGHVDSIHRV